ncbi:hypothetical protein [Rhodospira trueperi]|nr:hypothetical protein [Rhodospira trueperi]
MADVTAELPIVDHLRHRAHIGRDCVGTARGINSGPHHRRP